MGRGSKQVPGLINANADADNDLAAVVILIHL